MYGVKEPYIAMPDTFKSKAAERAAVTVLLTNAQIAEMDEVTASIRRKTGRSISRSALLRAITTAALTLHTDWIQCRDENDVCILVLARLGKTLDLQSAERKFNELKQRKAV
jgi:hypothetical protein